MSAPDLLSWKAAAHKGGGDTEHAAARSADKRVGTDCQAVLAALRAGGAMSATEIAARLGWPDVYRARRRISDLRHHFLVEDSGVRAKTALGRAEIVWAAVAQ